MASPDCISREELHDFYFGDLQESRCLQIEEHLKTCSACQQGFRELEEEDPLLTVMSSNDEAGEDDGKSSVLEIMNRLLLPPDRTPEFASSEADLQSTVSAFNQYSFLAPAQNPDEIGRIGSFRVLEVLGAGGMGIVFRAEDPRLGRQVAIKVLKPEIRSRQTERIRFLREARAMAKLQSDYVVPLLAIDEENGVPFLVMPYLKGQSLEDRLSHGEPLSLLEIIKIGKEIAIGLGANHIRDLIHRDIKPGNIWLQLWDDPANERDCRYSFWRVKILDFGLVRARDEVELTQSGQIVGSPAYMSPEQAMGKPVDARSDLFSLGSVLYRICSGRIPFSGETAMGVLTNIVNTPAKPLTTYNPKIPANLNRLVLWLLEKDPAKRPDSAQAVVEEFLKIEADIKEKYTGKKTNSRLLRAGVFVTAVLFLGGMLWISYAFFWRVAYEKPSQGKSSIPGPITKSKSKPQDPYASIRDPNRRVSKWVIDHGGSVRITFDQKNELYFAKGQELPQKKFLLIGVHMSGGVKVKDEDLPRFQKVPNLYTLNLPDEPITNQGAKHLRRNSRLSLLDLSRTKITDEGLKEIGAMHWLFDLRLSGNQITDKGLGYLKNLKRLSTLDIERIDATEEGVANLIKALPQCQIKSDFPRGK